MDLETAFDFETEELKEMMSGMMEEAGYEEKELTEFDIRNFLLARRYLEKEAAELKDMKKAVVSKWDERIKKKEESLSYVTSAINKFMEKSPKKKLEFDVGTISRRKVPHKISFEDEKQIRLALHKEEKLANFLKPAQLDTSSLRDHYMAMIQERVEEETKTRVDAYIEEHGKITKANEKKIIDQVVLEKGKEFANVLPEGATYVPQSESVQIKLSN